jgi:hypothetical protein
VPGAEGAELGQGGRACGIAGRAQGDRAYGGAAAFLREEQLVRRTGQPEAELRQVVAQSGGTGPQFQGTEDVGVLLHDTEPGVDRDARAVRVVAGPVLQCGGVPRGRAQRGGALVAAPDDGFEEMARGPSQVQGDARGDDPGLGGGVGPASLLEPLGGGDGRTEEDGRTVARRPARAEQEVLGQEHPAGALLGGEGAAGPLGGLGRSLAIAVGELGVRQQEQPVGEVAPVALGRDLRHRGRQERAGLAGQARLDERLAEVETALRDAFARQVALGDGEQPQCARNVAAPGGDEGEIGPSHRREVPQLRGLSEGDGLGQRRFGGIELALQGPCQAEIGEQADQRHRVAAMAEPGQGAGGDPVGVGDPSGTGQGAGDVGGQAVGVGAAQDALGQGRLGEAGLEVAACRQQADEVHPYQSGLVAARPRQRLPQQGQALLQQAQLLGGQPGGPQGGQRGRLVARGLGAGQQRTGTRVRRRGIAGREPQQRERFGPQAHNRIQLVTTDVPPGSRNSRLTSPSGRRDSVK